MQATPHGASTLLFKKQRPEDVPVTPKSVALFRFGEQCNNNCPMCSNTGEAGLFFHSTEELLRRAAFLKDRCFRRVIVTGGEPTIHPGFWTVIERLAGNEIVWDVNTHGRSFSKPGFAERSFDTGLRRAIVSLHSFDPATSAAIFGADEKAHHETVAGIDRLLDVGVKVLLNCVITELNLPQLDDYLRQGFERYGQRIGFKIVFPSTIGKGGRWPGVAKLRYDNVREPIRDLKALSDRLQARLFLESIPNCIVGDPGSANVGRSGFGETHYLDDATGDRVYSMRHIEAELSAYGEACRSCAALRRCPGVARAYAERYGVGELKAF